MAVQTTTYPKRPKSQKLTRVLLDWSIIHSPSELEDIWMTTILLHVLLKGSIHLLFILVIGVWGSLGVLSLRRVSRLLFCVGDRR